MNVKVNFLCTVVLCCLCHGDCLGTSSAVSAGTVTPCIGDGETISFCDAYFTRLAFINRRIKCRGVLTKIKYGPLILRPVEGELRDDEHIVHAKRYPFIGIDLRNGDERSCRELQGKTVLVDGILSMSRSKGSLPGAFESPNLLRSRIIVAGCALDKDKSDEILTDDQVMSHFQYVSPCREFKATIHLANGGRYMIHYYSAVLWMACVGIDGHAYVADPISLYPRSEDAEKIRRIWTTLSKLETSIYPSTGNSCRTAVNNCRPKRYSQIKQDEFCDSRDDSVAYAKELFQVGYGSSSTNEMIEVAQ